MVSIRTGLAVVRNNTWSDPAVRFVSDFVRLIADINRLLVDVGGTLADEKIFATSNNSRRGPHLHETISALREDARLFERAIQHFRSRRNEAEAVMHHLLVNINSAESVKAVGESVANYCSKVFGACAGMVFFEDNDDLQLRSDWLSGGNENIQALRKMLRVPAATVLRSGKPLFLSQMRKPRRHVSRRLRRLSRIIRGSAAVIPIAAVDQRPVGVLVIAFPKDDFLNDDSRENITELGRVVSGALVRARLFDDALASQAQAEQIHEDFLSMLSHELRNAMMPISGWAVALSSGSVPPEKQALAMDAIVRNIRALGYLVEDLFDSARISSGKLRLKFEDMRIQDVAREALSSIQYAAETKKLRIATDISEAVPPFRADPRRVRQVLMNLLSNAIKFTPAGGSVGFKILRRGGMIECIVSDTGKGIKPKLLRYVFDRFWQENGNRTSKGSGLGLGLTIVHEIVTLHGGTVEAQSHGVNRGATFTVRLPIRRPKQNPSRNGNGLEHTVNGVRRKSAISTQ